MAEETKSSHEEDSSKAETRTSDAAKEDTQSNDASTVVPQLSAHNITFGDLQVAVRVLQAVSSLTPRKKNHKKSQPAGAANENNNPLDAYKHKNLRPFRKALAGCLELHKRTMFQGRDEEDHYERRVQERQLKRQKMAESQQQKAHLATTALRRGRTERLQALLSDHQEEEHAKLLRLAPDGHVETASVPMLLEQGDAQPKDDTNDNIENDNSNNAAVATTTNTPTLLPKLRSCYVCKARFRELHAFYDQLCPSCAALNWDKRHATVDLTGKVAVVTGARVKIGYQTSLKLLRAGATVVATTRFPNAAAAVYRQETDFAGFADRLHVYGLDLRDVSGLEAFCAFLQRQFGQDGIDIVINNACQTVRRPAGYYTPQVQREQELWETADDTHKAVLSQCREFERVRRQMLRCQSTTVTNAPLPKLLAGANDNADDDNAKTLPPSKQASSDAMVETATEEKVSTALETRPTHQDDTTTPFEARGISHSAALSQVALLPEDSGLSATALPPGLKDINGQQLDLRHTNSWLLKMDQVSTPEIMECFFINAVAPFVLNSRLVPLLAHRASSTTTPPRFIVNVSAMEGKFYRYKMPNHPHTNMAKAALNMMTRTSSQDLAKRHGIYMNSVDTGWINDENPAHKAAKIAEENNFQTPIDEIDAAARILDPVFVGLGPEAQLLFGKFLKDYRETEW